MAGASTEVGSVHYTLDLDDDKFQSKLGKASEGIRGLEGALKSAEQGSKMFAGALAAIGTAAVGAAAFGVKMAANLETMTQGFVTLLGSTEKADEAIKMIKEDAKKTPFELPGLVQANQLLTSVTKDAGKSERLLLNIGKALTAMGKGQNELDRIIVNLQQIGAIGHATKLDIKQFAFAGIPIFDMLNEKIKGTGGNLDDMIREGEITFEMLTEMFQEAGEGSGKFARAFELQGGTFNQIMSNFRDNIGIVAGDLVKQLGIFDAVKQALSNLTQAIGNLAKPESIAMIKSFIQNTLIPNFPIITGMIIGGLVPALYALAGGFIAAMAPLIPFIAAGGVLALLIDGLIEKNGGLQKTINKLNPIVTELGNIFKDKILPELQKVWNEFSAKLLPALNELWALVEPILIPVLKALAGVLGAVLLQSILMAINNLRLLIIVFTDIVQFLTENIKKVKNLFESIPEFIKKALGGIKDIILSPFREAFDSVIGKANEAISKVKEALDFSKRHSPSVLDIVKRGVNLVNKELESLANVTFPSIGGLLIDDMALQGVRGQTTNQQDITMYIDKVGDMQDIQAIGRELGFRTGLDPRMFES